MPKLMPFLKWGFVFLLAVIVYGVMPALEYAPHAPLFMALTTFAVSVLALELMALEPTVIILTALYILTRVASPKAVLEPWTTGTVWIIFGSIVIGYVIIKAGLARRIALMACVKLGGSYFAVMTGLVIAGFILGPVVSSAIGKAVILSAIAVGCCQVLKLEPQSKEATGLLLAGFFGADPARMSYMTGGADIIMAIGFLHKMMPEATPTWMDYFIHNFPVAVAMTAVSLFSAYMLLRPKQRIDSLALRKQYLELPPVSLEEKKAAVLLTVTLLIFLTESIHKININFLIMCLAGVVFFPGLNILNKSDYPKINLWMVIFVAGCMSIGSTAIATGVDKWLAEAITPYMGGSSFVAMLKIYAAGIGINFILTPLAACSSMMVPLIEMMNNLGHSPLLGIYTFLQGLDQYIFPYEVAILLLFYTSGYMSLKWISITLALRMALSILVMICIAYPYWKALGLA